MLAYGATAQLALAQFPQTRVTPPPPIVIIPPRPNPRGVVTVVDVVPSLTYGTKPAVRSPFALIINQPFIYTPTGLVNLTLQFTAPSGKVQLSDNRYLSVNSQPLLQNEQLSTYVVYQAGANEFIEAGVWSVVVQTAHGQSAAYFFTITNA